MTDPKFQYGYDVEPYIQKALEILKARYSWADQSLFQSQYRYAIEQENGAYHYVRYVVFGPDEVKREVQDAADPRSAYAPAENAQDFIDRIVADQDYTVLHSNAVVEVYEVPFPRGLHDEAGWTLEHYQFKRLATGDFLVTVQAGDRFTGGSRDFFVPAAYVTGGFDKFLDQYCALVPGEQFFLHRDYLEQDVALKRFLGF